MLGKVVPDFNCTQEFDLRDLPSGSVNPTKSKKCSMESYEARTKRLGKILRVSIRYSMLFTLLLGLGGLLYQVNSRNHFTDIVTFTESTLEISVTDCEINLHFDESLPSGTVHADVITYGQDPLETTDDSLHLSNGVNNREICKLSLYASVYPSLAITCENECWIEQLDSKIEVDGAIIISTESESVARVKLNHLIAESIEIDIEGTVSIENLETTNGGTFKVLNGDLFLASTQDSRFDWETYESGAYSMAGPRVTVVSSVNCAWSQLVITSETQYDVEECTGGHTVCSQTSCSLVQYEAVVTNGGVYFVLVNEQGDLAENYEAEATENESAVDLVSSIRINRIKNEVFNSGITKDVLVYMGILGPLEDYGQWLYSTNIAYLQLKPWWLSLVSLGLLVPEYSKLALRIVPYPAIWVKGELSTDELGGIWKILVDEYEDRDQDEVVWMETSEDQDNWYKFAQRGDFSYDKSLISLDQNPYLLAALSISAFLGLAASVASSILCFYLFKRYSGSLWNRYEHFIKYFRCKATIEIDAENAKLQEEERETANRIADSIETTFSAQRLPPPFAIPDLFFLQWTKNRSDSLATFLKRVMVKFDTEDEVHTQFVRVHDLKEHYEAFCFINGYIESDIKERGSLLSKFGIDFVTLTDASTEVFKKLRLKTQRERQESITQLPNENSLQFFLRARCVVTPFEIDSISIKQFSQEYMRFTRMNKLNDPTPVTKRAMEKMGAVFERQSVLHLKVHGKMMIDMSNIEELILKHVHSPCTAGWILSEIISVIFHILIVTFVVAAVITLPILLEVKIAEFSARDRDSVLSLAELLFSGSKVFTQLENLSLPFYILLVFPVLLFVVSLLELITYYCWMPVPFTPQEALSDGSPVKNIMHKVFYITFFVLVGVLSGYTVIILCWNILGAVLNPDVYLPYAASAMTLLTFTMVMGSKLVYLHTQVLKKVKEAIWLRMNSLMQSTIGGIVVESDAAGAQSGIGTQETRTLSVFTKTPLGKLAETIGIDHKTATALIQGEETAVLKLAEQFGVHHLLINYILAIEDSRKLMGIVSEISSIPGVDLDPDLAKILVQLSLKQTDANIRRSVKMATIQFNKLHINETADPRVVEALVALSRGFATRFIGYLSSSDNVSGEVLQLLKLIEALANGKKRSATKLLVALMQEVLRLDTDLIAGLASLCDESYGAVQQGDFSGWDQGIELLCIKLGLPDTLIVELLINEVREANGNIQKLTNSRALQHKLCVELR